MEGKIVLTRSAGFLWRSGRPLLEKMKAFAAEVEYNTIIGDGASSTLDVFSTFGYNGLLTMKSKTSYAMSTGGGVGIWELSGDAAGTNSLLTAINQVVTAGGAVPTNAPVGQTVTLKGFNNLYVSGENGTKSMTCTRTAAQGWEEFGINQ
jgi:chitinase